MEQYLREAKIAFHKSMEQVDSSPEQLDLLDRTIACLKLAQQEVDKEYKELQERKKR